MAAQGELGVVGHPAPREVTERFGGDVVAAQLGNAALGVVAAAVALALVHRAGRSVPAVVLAAGALGALLSGVAGVLVVASSLAGLREDHGQWGVDSLVLGVVPIAAWAVLVRSALRAVRAEGPPRAMRVLAPLRVRPVAAAVTGCVAYGALKLHWALGGQTLMRQAPLDAGALRELLAREPLSVAGHWASLALAVAGVCLAVATVRRPRLPRPLAVWLPCAIGVLMLARAGYGAASDVAVLGAGAAGSRSTAWWDLALWSPFFGGWGAAWVLVARRSCSSIWLRSALGSRPSRRSNEEAT
jgi:hypothetical protein